MPKNSLDKALQEHFRTFNQRTITEEKVDSFFKEQFDHICQLYKESGGRSSKMEYQDITTGFGDCKRFSIECRNTTSMYISLSVIRGDLP